MIPPIIPLTGDTPRLHQHVSRSHVARRHANALPTQATQIPVALRRHERNFATQSVHTLEANISHDTANHPAHQRHAAFTPCFALPCGTVPLKHRQSSRSPATRRAYSSVFRAPQWHGAAQTQFPPRPRNSHWHCDITNVISPHGRPIHYKRFVRDVLQSHASSLQDERFARDFLQKSRVKSPKQAFRTRLPPKVTRQVSKTSVSYETPQKVTRQVSKTSVSYETSSKTHMSKSAKRAFRTRLPPKVKRKRPSEHTQTHITHPCQAVSRFQPLQATPAHTPVRC